MATEVSEDLSWAIVRMAPCMPVDAVSHFTGVSNHTIYEILALYHKTGKVIDQKTSEHRKYRQLTLPPEVDDNIDEERTDFVINLGPYCPNQLVFLGERSFFHRKLGQSMVWDVSSRRTVRRAGQKRHAVISALSLDGILSVDLTQDHITQKHFAGFIDGLLDQMNPYPSTNSIIVMENCDIYNVESTLQMIRDRGMRYVFLPSYCPDLDPIDLAFSAIKTDLQNAPRSGIKAESDAQEELIAAIVELHQAVFSVTKEDAGKWLKYCNYL